VFIVTVHGRPVARVTPLDSRPRTMPTEVFFAALAKVGADSGLIGDLEKALGDTTDDVDPWSG
jgi:antitoxin (DNA-binding transcriptional repressor) of toxin-antitoxin stability system